VLLPLSLKSFDSNIAKVLNHVTALSIMYSVCVFWLPLPILCHLCAGRHAFAAFLTYLESRKYTSGLGTGKGINLSSHPMDLDCLWVKNVFCLILDGITSVTKSRS
jgi:hypothetical protein